MAEPITRTILERFDVPDSNFETVIMHVEVAPQMNTGLHTHPGFDAAYLLEGELTVVERGQPNKPIRPGQSWHIRPGIVHEVKAGNRAARVLAMYVVEKGKPLATPWPSDHVR
jgi:quercetin dioxygenase-like cupin family protein